MPLSEHDSESRRVRKSLSKQDPRFAKNVRETKSIPRRTTRSLGHSGILVGLLVLIFFFSESILLGSSA